MSISSPCSYNSFLSPQISLHSLSSSSSNCLNKLYLSNFNLIRRNNARRRRRSLQFFVLLSTHSNPKLLKPSRRNLYGQTLSPYDSDIDDYFDDSSDDEDSFDDDEEDSLKENSLLYGGISLSDSLVADVRRLQSNGAATDRRNGKGSGKKNPGVKSRSVDLSRANKREKDALKLSNVRFGRLAVELELDERYFPYLEYLTTFGLNESHFMQMYERHMPSLQKKVSKVQERLDYLMSVGVKRRDIKKMLLKQPQILDFAVENNRNHVEFFVSLGIPDSRIGQIITARPSLLSYSVEKSLKPTVKYLLEEVGIKKSHLGKVVQLSPQILDRQIDKSWNSRFSFLAKEIGAPKANVVKMVTRHPQLLHYSIEDGLLPRIKFLRSIGMRNSDILKLSTSLTQVFSLSVEGNLKPKYLYLIHDLRNKVQSLNKYPTYLSLSLNQRIRPRHRFLVSLKKAPKGPFPLGMLMPTDEDFCQQWAGISVDKYLAFRQLLLRRDIAKKNQRLNGPKVAHTALAQEKLLLVCNIWHHFRTDASLAQEKKLVCMASLPN